jgi:hypothetical protein
MNQICQAFTNKFIEIIKNCVPQKEVTIRLNDKVWLNSEFIRREIRKRDRLRKLARRSNSDFNINKYKKQRFQVQIQNPTGHCLKNWLNRLEIYHQ